VDLDRATRRLLGKESSSCEKEKKKLEGGCSKKFSDKNGWHVKGMKTI